MTFTPAVPDPPELDEILWSGFSKTKTAFDVGSNAGQTLSKILKFADEIHAFEPEPHSYAYLEKWYNGREEFWLNNVALSDVHQTIYLAAVPGKIETGQLVTSGTEGMEWSEAEKTSPLMPVEAIPLDLYVEETKATPGFIKIDVEGHEDRVLAGAKRTLDFARPEMLIEIHSESLGMEIQGLLEHLGYDLTLVRHPHYAEGSTLWESHFWYKAFP